MHMKRIKPMKMIKNNQSVRPKSVFSRFAQGILLACLMLGFGFAELQAQEGASFYNSVEGAVIDEVTVEPGDVFTMVVGVDNTVLVDGVTATMSYDTSLLTHNGDVVVDLVGPLLPFPFANSVDHEAGILTFTKAMFGGAVEPGGFEYMELSFTVNADVVFNTTTDIMHVLEGNDKSDIVHFGVQLMEASPTMVVTIFTGVDPSDCPDLGLNIGDACSTAGDDVLDGTVNDACECIADVVDCLNGTQYPSFSAVLDGSPNVVTISGCSYEAEYSVVENAVNGSDYTFTSVGGGGYITVRSGTVDGPVLGAGYSPLTITSDIDGTLYPHWTVNELCETASGCVTTTVQCTSCVWDCPEYEANIGSACDDGDDTTYDETLNEDCECIGIPYDCPLLFANIGDACDDGDDSTINDTVTADCECIGEGIPDAPENDLACDAIALECGDLVTGNTEWATNSANKCNGATGGNDVWYSFTTDAETIVTIETCLEGTTFDTDFSVFTGECDALECFDGFGGNGHIDGDPGCSWASWASGGVFTALPGVTYTIQLAGYSSSSFYSGDYAMSVSCEVIACESPSLDLAVVDAAGAPIDAECVEVGGEFYVSATIVGGSGNDNYNVSANGGAPVLVAAGGTTSFGPYLAGTNVEVSAVGADDDICGTSASTTLAVCPPSNDTCADAIAVACDDYVVGSNIGASLNTGCNGNDRQTVWYSFTSDVAASVYLNTCNPETNFDTDLNVYTGTCDELVCFPGFEGNGYVDGAFGCEFQSYAAAGSMEVEAGVTYSIAVTGYYVAGGFSGWEGTFGLSVSCEIDYDCPELEANIGDDCGENGTVNENCECIETEPGECVDWVTYINDNEGGETDIYGVDISGGNAELTYLTTLDYHAHMAYNPADNMLYVVNNTTGYYVVVNPHVSPVTVGLPMLLSEDIPSITTAAFAPNGKLLVGSSTQDVIYSIDILDNSVSVFDAYAPISGGDIAFDSEGMLYLATRSGNGLYEVYPDDVWDDQYIGSVANLVTGMALTASEQLLTSHNGNPNLNMSNLDGTDSGLSFPLMLDGEAFMHHNGDLASGCNTFSDTEEGDCDLFNTFYADLNRPGVVGTDLYGVIYTDGGDANMTFLTNTDFNSHIAYNAESDIVYMVNANGSFIRAYDPTAGIFLGDLPIVGGLTDLVAIVYNPEDGLLYVGSSASDDLHSIDLGTGISTYLMDAPVEGGDLAIQGGTLYLATRTGASLYEISGGVATLVGGLPVLVNGMAQANNATDMIIANRNAGVFTKISAADASVVGTYTPMIGGEAITLYDGDMAAGCGDDEPIIVPGGECYATEIIEYVEGSAMGGGSIPAERADASQALGAPEGTDELVFVALGYGGSLTVGFGGMVPNEDGDDIEVVETSFNNPGCEAYPEFADVYVSVDGIDWHMAGNVCKGDPYVDISDAGDFDYVMYVMVVNTDATTTSSDGFDVDGIVALHNCEDDGSGDDESNELVAETSVMTSFPNPTNGPSQVVFTTAVTGRTLVEVFDMNGRSVEVLFNQEAQEGQEYRIDFNGAKLPNGVYIYKMTTNNETIVNKFMIAK